MNITPGAVIRLFDLDNGSEFYAFVDDVTKGRRIRAWWIGSTRGRGDFITKTRTIDFRKYRIVKVTDPQAASDWLKRALALRSETAGAR